MSPRFRRYLRLRCTSCPWPGKPTVSASEVAEALGTDPSIALRFLSIANSAFFSANQRITTLSHCVAWLGLEFVKATLVSLSIGSDGGGIESPYLTRTTLWQHNMGGSGLLRDDLQPHPRLAAGRGVHDRADP